MTMMKDKDNRVELLEVMDRPILARQEGNDWVVDCPCCGQELARYTNPAPNDQSVTITHTKMERQNGTG